MEYFDLKRYVTTAKDITLSDSGGNRTDYGDQTVQMSVELHALTCWYTVLWPAENHLILANPLEKVHEIDKHFA